MAGERTHRDWLTTEEAAGELGMTAEWVRQQIHAKRLPATAIETGRRRTYRIRRPDWVAFRGRYARRTDEPEWE